MKWKKAASKLFYLIWHSYNPIPINLVCIVSELQYFVPWIQKSFVSVWRQWKKKLRPNQANQIALFFYYYLHCRMKIDLILKVQFKRFTIITTSHRMIKQELVRKKLLKNKKRKIWHIWESIKIFAVVVFFCFTKIDWH